MGTCIPRRCFCALIFPSTAVNIVIGLHDGPTAAGCRNLQFHAFTIKNYVRKWELRLLVVIHVLSKFGMRQQRETASGNIEYTRGSPFCTPNGGCNFGGRIRRGITTRPFPFLGCSILYLDDPGRAGIGLTQPGAYLCPAVIALGACGRAARAGGGDWQTDRCDEPQTQS